MIHQVCRQGFIRGYGALQGMEKLYSQTKSRLEANIKKSKKIGRPREEHLNGWNSLMRQFTNSKNTVRKMILRDKSVPAEDL